jgi:hypothetical protein
VSKTLEQVFTKEEIPMALVDSHQGSPKLKSYTTQPPEELKLKRLTVTKVSLKIGMSVALQPSNSWLDCNA